MGWVKKHSRHFLHVCVLFHSTCATIKGGWQAQVVQLNGLTSWELCWLAAGKAWCPECDTVPPGPLLLL